MSELPLPCIMHRSVSMALLQPVLKRAVAFRWDGDGDVDRQTSYWLSYDGKSSTRAHNCRREPAAYKQSGSTRNRYSASLEPLPKRLVSNSATRLGLVLRQAQQVLHDQRYSFTLLMPWAQ